jgi:hypothetical protein
MPRCVCVEGGKTASVKSGLKEEKLSVRPRYFLDCAQVFYTSRGGGSEAPIRRMARWGLQVKIHRTSIIKIKNSILVQVFTITFYTAFCTGRTYVKRIKTGVKILNSSTENMIDNFSPGIA